MKKAEAISILATSVRPREPKDRARYDKAVKMAIEALKGSERTAETIQSNHIADVSKKVERAAETAQNVQNGDLISRKAAIDALGKDPGFKVKLFGKSYDEGRSDQWFKDVHVLTALPSAQPDNQINLCDSCDYSYPECPSEKDDVIFGNGIGNDNICACNKYQPTIQPEIVRCKGCEYFRIIDYNELECVHPELRVYTPDFEFGCISGKRRTDEK